ncbi:Phage-related baseplate assembly protein [compost metagenome]
MFNPANTPHFNLYIQGAPVSFKVVAFGGEEAISKLYRIEIDLVSERAVDLAGLLNEPAFLAFSPQQQGIHGLIREARQTGNRQHHHYYQLSLEPQLANLALRTNQRIFQRRNVQQIIATLLGEHGLFAHEFRLQDEHPERVYCVQYDESDLDFISRLCEEEGIHYHFEHSPGGHLLVFGDAQTAFLASGLSVGYHPDDSQVADRPVVKQFDLQLATRTSRVTRRDYNFEKPRIVFEGKASGDGQPDLEDYDYPGLFNNQGRGKQLSQISLERHRHDQRLALGQSDHPGLMAGTLFTLVDHPQGALNDLWLLTKVHHSGYQPQVLEELGDPDFAARAPGYRNQFVVAPWAVIQRPPLKHLKPRVLGSQTAVVTGPAGEEIHCDEYGRVKVQFHWDREGRFDEHSSCWVRVASNWAHDRYGSLVIPRIGMEVLVSFLEGDPDQPLIHGCLPHAVHRVPYDLPANKTRSVFKTRSSPGGGGYNELRIEDRKGAEQIYLHAERDQDIEVERNETHWVGNDRRKTIDHDELVHVRNDRTETVDHDETITVHNDRTEEVDGNERITVHKSRSKTIDKDEVDSIGKSWSVKVGRNKSETIGIGSIQNVGLGKMTNIGLGYSRNVGGMLGSIVGLTRVDQIGKTWSVTAGDKIEFICGDSTIVLMPDAIHIQAKDIHLKAQNRIHQDAPQKVHVNSGTAQPAPESDAMMPPPILFAAASLGAGAAAAKTGHGPVRSPNPGDGQTAVAGELPGMQARTGSMAVQVPAAAVSAPPVATGLGLGAVVDTLVAESPSLKEGVQGLLEQGWNIGFGTKGSGTYTQGIAREIVLDGGLRGNAIWTVQTLAQEVGHAAADLTTTLLSPRKVQQEILAATGVEIGLPEAVVATASPTAGPGHWVTVDDDYLGIANTGVLLFNRLTSMGDEGRLFGSEGKDFQNTMRDKVQEWRPLPKGAHPRAVEASAIRPYGEVRKVRQHYREAPDAWAVDGRSWHWQPVTADSALEAADHAKD